MAATLKWLGQDLAMTRRVRAGRSSNPEHRSAGPHREPGLIDAHHHYTLSAVLAHLLLDVGYAKFKARIARM